MSTAANRWRKTLGYQVGLVGFTCLSNIVLLRQYALRIDLRYLPRALLFLAISGLSSPLRLLERIVHGRRIAEVNLDEPPIFIVGHWRSGTTHLHNLMSLDPRLGYVTMYQAALPEGSLVAPRWLRNLIGRLVPLKRPMDNMQWPMDAPQEDEIPLAKTAPFSFYHLFSFPQCARQLLHDYLLFDGASARVRREFKRKYLRVLKIAALHANGRRLVLKNPANTGRIRLLLEMFPDAKFIHIHRCPYDVYQSTRNMYGRLHSLTALQPAKDPSTGEDLFYVYQQVMRRFMSEEHLIPPSNLIEVRFEDLERNPQAEMARIYEQLRLPGFAAVHQPLAAYLRDQNHYQKNQFQISAAEQRRVEQHWGFAFRRFGYAFRAH